MRIIYNNYIPFPGFKAINLFGIIFVRKDVVIDERTIRHERIHTKQMLELLVIGFYIWYLIEYIIRIPMYDFDIVGAYKNISFEREAYENENELSYLNKRKWFAFVKYII